MLRNLYDLGTHSKSIIATFKSKTKHIFEKLKKEKSMSKFNNSKQLIIIKQHRT